MSSGVSSIVPNQWRSFVERVLSVWSGYQLAIDFNSAGEETLQRHKWFVDVLAEHVCITRGLKVDDLEEWITSLLYNDFDLILDDDSVYPTSCLLLEAFSYMKNNNQERLAQLVSGLPTADVVQQVKRESRRDVDTEEIEMADVDENMNDEDTGDGEMEDDQEELPLQRERQPRMVTDEDGWTTILRR